MIRLTPDVRLEIVAHAVRERPNEACGLVSSSATVSLIDVFHPMTNAAASPEVFELDGQEHYDTETSIEAAGRHVVGVVHSHTVTSAYPSPTDVRDSARFDPTGDYVHLIVSLRDAEPSLRAFHILDGDIVEAPILLTDGDDDLLGDGAGAAAAVAAVVPLRSQT